MSKKIDWKGLYNSVHPELTPEKRLQWFKLTGKALRAFPGSPRQKAIQAEITKLLS